MTEVTAIVQNERKWFIIRLSVLPTHTSPFRRRLAQLPGHNGRKTTTINQILQWGLGVCVDFGYLSLLRAFFTILSAPLCRCSRVRNCAAGARVVPKWVRIALPGSALSVGERGALSHSVVPFTLGAYMCVHTSVAALLPIIIVAREVTQP